LYALHRNSYCFAQKRFVPEAELVNAAIDEELNYLREGEAMDGHEFVLFKDRDEFLRLNPGCCKIVSGDEEREPYQMHGRIEMVLGYYGAAIQLKYTLRTREADGSVVERKASPFIILDSCGGKGVHDFKFLTSYGIN
jgi:hypothetical protein